MKQVLRTLNDLTGYKRVNKTIHIKQDRSTRMNAYDSGDFLGGFIVDTGHKDGLEVHIIDNQGYIHIFNKQSKRYITVLSGRPSQIKLYYRALNLNIPDEVHKAIKISFTRNKTYNANYLWEATKKLSRKDWEARKTTK